MTGKEKHIWDFVNELLHEHDCVIVPGFGGFVCNPEHAKIDQVSHLITPPAKHVVFNQNLKTNDGLLASRIAEQLNMHYSDAIRMIEETVSRTKDLLQEKKFFVVDFFGSFRLNAEANYVFLPEKSNTFSYQSFGLLPVQAHQVSSRNIRPKKVRLFKDRKTLREAHSNRKRATTTKILVGTFGALLALNIVIFIKNPELRISGNTMNISGWFDSLFHSQTPQVNPPVEVKDAVVENDTFIPVSPLQVEEAPAVTATEAPIDTVATEETTSFDMTSFAKHIAIAKENTTVPYGTAAIPDNGTQPALTIIKPSSISSGDSAFYIIGGVFCKLKYAKRFFHQLEEKGFTPEMIINERINCNRVSYYKFFSRKEAEQELRNIHTTINTDAWILAQHQ